jgi:hypothetical protein
MSKTGKSTTQGTVTLPEKDRRALRSAIDRNGEAAVLKEVGATGETFARLLAGLPVRRGSVALALNYLARQGAAA